MVVQAEDEAVVVVVVVIMNLERSGVSHIRILALIDTKMNLDIEFVQVQVLQYVVGMQITNMVPILIAQVVHQEAVILVMVGILADIEALHLLIFGTRWCQAA
ncbi:uncharacterized protein LOC120134144 [Hibiscus syriacus]|uniref:uncharacterized protein LOC120134144 n=1 Tax=Hibiscus syriacus TaxID=106335 RepID=UPI0019206FD1|nr:uncharacterized protein LOC120134144 [Hibiscus syriacus]